MVVKTRTDKYQQLLRKRALVALFSAAAPVSISLRNWGDCGTYPSGNVLRIGERIQGKTGEASNAREVFVEGENGGAVIHGDGGNQSVDRG